MKMIRQGLFAFWLFGVALFAAQPNVILVMTDDQGYGDLAVHGNPVLKTPNLDRLHGESVRFTDFHVSPFCTPTRAALLTGRYAARTGAYRTSHGRTNIHPREVTMAKVFADGGYRTGMFGKWHLGDNFPSRPMDKGFQYAVWHRCGGVTQISDYYGNDYFDDTYLVNGEWRKFEGYCTDVWFREALRFIEENRERPFFVYIPTNAPHGPYLVAERYQKMYEELGEEGSYAAFKGMITNFDENLGKLMERLDEWKLAEDTILIFMTDNGSARGAEFPPGLEGLDALPISGFNAGMRGKKSSPYDGGHRVPLFVRWPGGELGEPRDIDVLSAHVDLLPTLMELTGVKREAGPPMDGRSLTPLLRGGTEWSERVLFSQIHGGPWFAGPGDEWVGSAVMTERWRLVEGTKLFDITKDPTQSNDVSGERPEVVTRLRAEHERWYKTLRPAMVPTRIVIGHEDENPAELTSQDWQAFGPDVVWSRGHLEKRAMGHGPWLVDVHEAGRYRLTLSRWPLYTGRAIDSVSARVRIGQVDERKKIEDSRAAGVSFEVDLSAGETELQTWLEMPDGRTHGAYFVVAERLRGL